MKSYYLRLITPCPNAPQIFNTDFVYDSDNFGVWEFVTNCKPDIWKLMDKIKYSGFIIDDCLEIKPGGEKYSFIIRGTIYGT